MYYVDNLCVHPDYRKDGIAPKTIQTHYYNLRKNNPKIKICLFKREGDLNAIVPLTTYKTVCFNINMLQKMNPGVLNVIEIGPNQLNLFVNFIYAESKKFDCIIMPDLSNISMSMEFYKTIILFQHMRLDDLTCFMIRRKRLNVFFHYMPKMLKVLKPKIFTLQDLIFLSINVKKN